MTADLVSPQLGLLRRFVEAAGWHSSDTGLVEAVPHLAQTLSPDEIIATLRNLGLPLCFADGRIADLAKPDLPTLRIGRNGGLHIVLDRRGDRVLVGAPGDTAPVWQAIDHERAMFVRIDSRPDASGDTSRESVFAIAREFRGTLGALFAVSLFTNLLALATPLLIMAIYDRAIPTRSIDLLGAMIVAVAIVFATDVALRWIRTRAVAHMGASMEGRLGMALFRKLAAIPLSEVEKSDADQQIARLRQFEGMRELFAGPVFTTILDLPFIVIFLGLLVVLSPAIAMLIVIVAVLFALAPFLSTGPLAGLNAAAAEDRTAHQKFLFETMQRQRTLQRLGIEELWRERHARLSETAADSTRRARQYQLSCQAFGQGLMTIAGVGSIFLGTHLAMASDLSFGALIAIMTLVWKTLAPIFAVYTNLPQLQGFLRSRRQIDRVLSLPEEFVRRAALSEFKTFRGALSLNGVSHRFPGAAEPSLLQVKIDVRPGECVVICGPNGSGKSVLLDLIDGLFVPSTGSLSFDAVSYRQIAVDDLRHMISYARQEPAFFHGTIWQNFQLAAPTLCREGAAAAIAAMDLDTEIGHLPEGLDTRLSESFRRGLSPATLRGLALARCLAKPAAVYLLDDPASGLDERRRAALAAWLSNLRGSRTVLIASDRPEHLRLADRFVYLDAGRVLVNDVGDAGRRKLDALLARERG